MSYGISFIDILISKTAMILAWVLFLFCCGLLFFKSRKLSQNTKTLLIAAIAVTGIYLAFILWLVVMWG